MHCHVAKMPGTKPLRTIPLYPIVGQQAFFNGTGKPAVILSTAMETCSLLQPGRKGGPGNALAKKSEGSFRQLKKWWKQTLSAGKC